MHNQTTLPAPAIRRANIIARTLLPAVASALLLQASAQAEAPVLIWTGATDNNWNNTSQNWADNGAPATFVDGDAVVFNDTAGAVTIAIPGAVSPSSVTVDSAGDITFAPAAGAGLSGDMPLRKQGTGTLAFSATNVAFTGTSTIEGGVLQIHYPAAYSPSSFGPIVFAGGTLTMSAAGAVVIDCPLLIAEGQTGGMRTGSATRIGGAVTGSGTFTITAGAITDFYGISFANFSGELRLNTTSATVRQARHMNSTNGYSASTGAELANASVVLNNVYVEPNTGGATTGTISFGALSNVVGTERLVARATNGTTVFAIGGRNLDTVFSGTIEDKTAAQMAALTKVGTGMFTLSGVNTYTGATTVSAGALHITGQLAGAGAVSVTGAGALGGSGTIAGSATYADGAALLVDVTGAGALDTFKVTGAVALGNVIKITPVVPDGATLVPGTYTILQATGGIAGAPLFIWDETAAPGLVAGITIVDSDKIQVILTMDDGSGTRPVINSARAVTATYRDAFEYTITASNAPTSYTAANLPAGWSINTVTGKITGDITATGNISITIAAINASGVATATLNITVEGAAGPFDWYVAPDGDDNATGTLARPFATIQRAQAAVSPGETVHIRGGAYVMQTAQVAQYSGVFAYVTNLDKSGAPGSPITYAAYQDEKPVFDFTNVNPAGYRIHAFSLKGSWLRIRGLEVTGVQVNITGHTQSICFEITGNDNILERLSMHDGKAIGVYMSGNAARNLVLNCDAYNNWDDVSENGAGGNVDGFGCHGNGAGNIFRGCRAWYNSDDGFDCINLNQSVIFENCWALYNGYSKDGGSRGDGTGFKAGGYGVSDSVVPNPIPRNTVRHSIAVKNKRGFYANHHPGGDDWYNNTAYQNGSDYNFLGHQPDPDSSQPGVDVPGTGHVIRNNLSHGNAVNRTLSNLAATGNTMDHNVIPTTAADSLADSEFESVDFTQLMTLPRKASGDLPDITFLKPKPGSVLIDAGVDVGLPYAGLAPDIGAHENTIVPVITSPLTAAATQGVFFTYAITALHTPFSYGATNLPAGLSIDTTTGVISGTPAENGSFNITLSATNADGAGDATLTLTIAIPVPDAPVFDAGATVTINSVSGEALAYTIAITSDSPVTFSATALPAGLSIDTTTGVISGTPAVTGAFTITITATNDGGSVTQQITFNISRQTALVTLAGGAPNPGDSDGQAMAVRFNTPASIAAHTDGKLYVADTVNNAIRAVDSLGNVTKLTTALSRPAAIISAGSMLVVADTGNNAILAFDPSGAQLTTLATGIAQPAALARDTAGNLYIASASRHVIYKLAPGSDTATLLAGELDTSGTTDGPLAAARLNAPGGLAFDTAGSLYVADTLNSAIRRIDLAAGAISTIAGQPGVSGANNGPASDARFNTPKGLIADAAGNLYIADTGNHVIRRLDILSGVVTTSAGLVGTAGTDDGFGTDARLRFPAALAIDGATGDIYVADTGNHSIRIFLDSPRLLKHPEDISVPAGSPAAFTVLAIGAPNPDYQWHKDGAIIAGGTGYTYTLASAQIADEGKYSVIISNEMATLTSNTATLTVTASTSGTTSGTNSGTTPPPTEGSNNSEGGGGGAPGLHYLLALALLAATRRFLTKHAANACSNALSK